MCKRIVSTMLLLCLLWGSVFGDVGEHREFTVTYEPGEHGSGQMEDGITYGLGETAQVLPNRFAPEQGYRFAGFTLDTEGDILSVTYDPNGGEGARHQISVESNGAYALPGGEELGFSYEGKIFAGWALSADGEIAWRTGDQLAVQGETVLYAVWLAPGEMVTLTVAWFIYSEEESFFREELPYQALTPQVHMLNSVPGCTIISLEGDLTGMVLDGEALCIDGLDGNRTLALYVLLPMMARLTDERDNAGGLLAHADDRIPGAEGQFTVSGHVTLTAQWEALERVGVEYLDPVTMEIRTDPNAPYYSGETVHILSCSFTPPPGMAFAHWCTGPDGAGEVYFPGDTLEVTAPCVLYAVWTPAGGGPGPEPTAPPDEEDNEGEHEGQAQLDTNPATVYIQGYPDGTIQPDRGMARAEAAGMLAPLLRGNDVGEVPIFTDVQAGAWYAEDVALLSALGLMEGYGDGTFRPEAPITRGELVAILAKYGDVQAGDTGFSDVTDSHWAWAFIGAAYELGWVQGYPDGTFQPDRVLNRAEAVTMVNRVLERTLDGEAARELPQFPDLAEEHWAYAALMAAAWGGNGPG